MLLTVPLRKHIKSLNAIFEGFRGAGGTVQSPSGQTFQERRINESILASLERQVLDAIAARLPEWVSPDRLTVLGVLGGAITGISCFATHLDANFLYVAVIGVLLNWFGDSLDGSLARFRSIERKTYGPY